MHLDYTKVIILILWWRNFQLEYWRIFQLVSTMDKHIIGENAGKLWRLLSTDVHRKWTLQEVKDATGFNDLEAASAIGWLAREDKIQFELEHHSTKDKNVFLYLMLNVYF